ncbi:MAG: extracellular solute-binding protein, partial [Clostridia bacterium]|nr:extracellular solute-binding protein [Clostridia bacterium]
MKKLTRILSVLLALVMLLGLTPAMADEPVTLDWYVATNISPDSQTVFDAINAYMLEKINVTINFHWIDASEYSSKVSPMILSGQKMDIINCNSGIGYVDYVVKDAFLPIEDLLPEYAPETYAMIPEGLWNAMKVNGHIYGIPSYKDSVKMYAVMVN